MIPNTFGYIRANTVEEAINLLKEEGGQGKLLAGGHSLVPLMKFRLTTPTKLIDISRIAELRGVKKQGERLVIGALTTYKQLQDDQLVLDHLPVLAETVRQIGDIQVRNRGTIGGNLSHADPAADLPALALALDGLIELQEEDGAQLIEASDFFLGPLVTAMSDTSILTSVTLAIPPEQAKGTYLKYPHPASGYAVVGVCVIARKNEQGVIDYARVAINGASDVAYRATSVETALVGEQATLETIKKAAALAANDAEMGEDHFASSQYRKQLCQVYAERALNKILL